MKLAVYGLGYVGSVTAACLASGGHNVYGIDLDPTKVAGILAGKSPVLEPGLDQIIAACVADGSLSASDSATDVPVDTDLHMVCVGTPSNPNGSLNIDQVMAVAAEIGSRLGDHPFPVVVLRSTMLPGSAEAEIGPIVEAASGRVIGKNLGLASCPEFLRETSAIDDFFTPPFTVAGVTDDQTLGRLKELFSFTDAPFHATDLRTAELIKYACNAFHAVKVGFANEIGRFARAAGADGRQVMEIFCEDTQLNISPAYLTPGFAFGGSCLPKDVRALVHRSRSLDLDLPLLGSVLASNEQHLSGAVDQVLSTGAGTVALLGLAFKTGTDDLRESPYVRLAEQLIGKGIDLRVWDPDLRRERLIGQNLSFVDETLPHLARLLKPAPADAIAGAELVVVGTKHPDARAAVIEADVPVIDLRGDLGLSDDCVDGGYEGVAW